MKYIHLVLASFFLIAIASAQSQQPSPNIFPDKNISRPPSQIAPNTQQKSDDQKDNSNEPRSSLKPENTNNTQHKTENNHKERQNEYFIAWTTGNKIAVIASMAGLLQFLALVVTIFIMIKNSRRQLRAYVFPETFGLIDGGMINPPQPAHLNEPGAIMLIKNSGQTPAYGTISWAKIDVIEPINIGHLETPRLSEPVSVSDLGPQGTMSKAIWFGRPLTNHEIEDIKNGVKSIYLYGRIEYRDAFRKNRYINFRLTYFGLFPQKSGMSLTFCEKGNKAN